jgi:hypothetical protein
VPHVELKKAGAQTLKLKLFFDSYEEKKDISQTTNQLWKLMESKDAERRWAQREGAAPRGGV